MKINRSSILLILTLALALGNSFSVHCEEAQNDTVLIEFHKPTLDARLEQLGSATLDEFRSDPEFDYPAPKVKKPGFLQIQLSKLFEWLAAKFGKTIATIVIIIMAMILVAALSVLVFGLFKGEKQEAFYKSDRKDLEYSIKREDINEIDFKEAIELALSGADYRKALRMLFLATLKSLTDAKLIVWKSWKTNHDYQYELGDRALRDKFEQLSVFYEYTWYGNFDIDKSLFEEFKNINSELETLIG
jgi:hypothetical protein